MGRRRVWVYNTAATIRQGLHKGVDNKVLKEKLSLNWTGPFKIVAVGPSPAATQPDGRPLGDKLLYLDLPSNLSGAAAKPRVTVARCKPCANPYDVDDMPRHRPTVDASIKMTISGYSREGSGSRWWLMLVIREFSYISFLLRSLLRLGEEETGQVELVSNSLNTVLSYHNNAYFTPRRVP